MSSRNKRKWKSLTHKVEHLRLEVEDRDDSIKDLESEFLKKLSSVIDGSIEEDLQTEVDSNQISATVEFDEPSQTELPTAKEQIDELPEDIKKIWKSIASMTHPDKTKNDERKTALYLAASEAMKTCAIDEIIRIATILDIEIPAVSMAAVAKLESLAVELHKKILQKESSILWQWGIASSEVKLKIMDIYISTKKYKKKSS